MVIQAWVVIQAWQCNCAQISSLSCLIQNLFIRKVADCIPEFNPIWYSLHNILLSTQYEIIVIGVKGSILQKIRVSISIVCCYHSWEQHLFVSCYYKYYKFGVLIQPSLMFLWSVGDSNHFILHKWRQCFSFLGGVLFLLDNDKKDNIG